MTEIKTAEEIQEEIKTIWAMTDDPNPSRAKIAAALIDLSDRVSSFPVTPEEQEEENRRNRKISETMQRVVGTRGKVTNVVSSGPGDWSVVFSTEYAGLKAFYDYRYSKGVRLAKTPNGWVLSIG